jgi:hypothetical protein
MWKTLGKKRRRSFVGRKMEKRRSNKEDGRIWTAVM